LAAGLASIEVVEPGQAPSEDAAEEEGAQQLQRKEEVFAADCQTNRAIVAALAAGLSAAGDAQQELLELAELAGAAGQHALLLALCQQCVSGRAAESGVLAVLH
jgi:hypothetical protein